MTDPHSLLRHGWRESTKTINGVNLHVVEAGQPGDRRMAG
jgi:hypothetical protein